MTLRDSELNNYREILESFESIPELDAHAATMISTFSNQQEIAEYLNLVKAQKDKINPPTEKTLSGDFPPDNGNFPNLIKAMIVLAEQDMQK